MSETRKILVALDGSKHSEYALNWFIEKCLRPGDELIGYSAWQSPRLPTFSLKSPFQPPTEEWQKILSDIRKGIEKVDNDFSTTCQGKKIKNRFIDESMNPGEGICAAAKKENVDMVVMGTRGLSPLRRTVLGSVSDYVLHHANLPVAVVPMPEEQPAE